MTQVPKRSDTPVTTFDARLDATTDRVDHLDELVRTLVETRAPMRTVDEPRVALGGVDPAEAARLNARLLDQVPGHRIEEPQSVLVLAALPRDRAVDVVLDVAPADAEHLPAITVGLDGAAGTPAPREGDAPTTRRVRFGTRREEGPETRLAAIHLRLAAPVTVRLTRLAVEPVA